MNSNIRKGITALLAAVIVVSVLAVMPATAIIPSRTYTLDADFNEGILVGVEHKTVHNQLQLNKTATTLPFIWVPNSNEGTVSKVDTVTGKELGRYRVGLSNCNPSRTTVDLQGNCWVGNRANGTVVKIGLYEAGQYIDKNGNGTIETSRDLDGDGNITGNEILPLGEDECVLFEVLLGNSGSGPRGLAIDADNNLWAGTFSLASGNKFYHIGGDNGTIFDTIDISPYRSYGALIDGNGNIWSSCLASYVLKIDPTTKSITKVDLSLTSYGLGIDQNDHLFVAGWGQNLTAKIDVNAPHNVTYAPQYDSNCRGVAVTGDGDVWVINSKDGDVTRLDNNLGWKATIDIGAGNWGVMSTGAAVDAAGKVWACNYRDGYIYRIDPANDSIDLSKLILGHTGSGVGNHYSYSDMTGIISRTVTTKIGTWTVDFDSEGADMLWGTVSWNSNEPAGTTVTVKVRSSNDQSNWSAWETAASGVPLSSTSNGRYLEIETTLQIVSGDVSPILYDLTVEVGNQPPVADAGSDQVVEQDTLGGASVTLNGSGSTDDGQILPLTYNWTWAGGSATGINPTAILPIGMTTVTLTVHDGQFMDTDTVDITVEDTTPPVLTCPADVTVEQETADGTAVPLTATATDICDTDPTITSDELAIYPLGTTTVNFTATDDSGNSVSCSMNVTVEDTTDPEIIVTVSPDTLWSPNHKMVDIVANVTVSDICDAAPTVVLTSVTSDEPDDAKGGGDGKTVDDIQGTDIGTEDYEFQLRAERAGKGDGRVYTITYTVTDESGNSANASATVVVPHDMG